MGPQTLLTSHVSSFFLRNYILIPWPWFIRLQIHTNSLNGIIKCYWLHKCNTDSNQPSRPQKRTLLIHTLEPWAFNLLDKSLQLVGTTSKSTLVRFHLKNATLLFGWIAAKLSQNCRVRRNLPPTAPCRLKHVSVLWQLATKDGNQMNRRIRSNYIKDKLTIDKLDKSWYYSGVPRHRMTYGRTKWHVERCNVLHAQISLVVLQES